MIDNFQTQRFRLINVKAQDTKYISSLDEVREDISYIGKWGSRSGGEYHRSIEDCFHIGFDLPSGASQQDYQVMAVEIPQTGKVIGYMGLCPDYPEEGSLWISIIALKTEFHGMGIGREVISGLEENIDGAHFKALRAAVDLKNWPGLRFFQNLGFDRIEAVQGDETYADYKFAKVILVKNLLP